LPEYLLFGFGVERGGRFIKNENLGIPQIGARQRDLLPLAAGQVDAAVKAPSEHLFVAGFEFLHHVVRFALSSGRDDLIKILPLSDPPDGDILSRRHIVAHEVLKNYSDLAGVIVEVIFAKIDAVEINGPFRWVVKTRQQFDDRGLALAVLPDQRDTLSLVEGEIEDRWAWN